MSARAARTRWRLAAAGAALVAAYGAVVALHGAAPFSGPVARGLAERPWTLRVHAATGAVLLLAGALQLHAGLRSRRPRLHRALGRAYGLAALLAGASGMLLARHAYGGPAARLGFAVLGAGLLVATVGALAAARARRLADHRRWAVRSWALAFSAVTLRLELPLLVAAFGGAFRPAYVLVAWLCWVPNLMWAEWWLRRRAAPSTGAAPARMIGERTAA